jgi:hypothetical protein
VLNYQLIDKARATPAEEEGTHTLRGRREKVQLNRLRASKCHFNIAIRTVRGGDHWCGGAPALHLYFIDHLLKALLQLIAARQCEPSLFALEKKCSIGCADRHSSAFAALRRAKEAVCDLLMPGHLVPPDIGTHSLSRCDQRA